ncbi:hypothetical protein [Allomesorhizobium alhagi]|uniref:Uncharacterized protein n=1 Tax=Mesorhizobium alhagi CCNWXJ12-2 TaxID=1107882 RepID=H0HZK2_9HYPH|nr:hypothetical protein [Mesorhizobium alhagi]EHK53809.1 hypothetical protein MAXJ12_28193 [Mesorhizobium alhagi CCNWXJ12-2]
MADSVFESDAIGLPSADALAAWTVSMNATIIPVKAPWQLDP